MNVAWPSVLVVCGFVLLVAVSHMIATFFFVRRAARAATKAEVAAAVAVIQAAVREEMEAAVKAVSKRLDASEIYLTAAEQHTALLGDWEKQRQADHDRRQKEFADANRRMIREEIARQLQAATAAVVTEVHKNPDLTADKVIERATDPASGLPSFRQPGTGDSHHG